MFGFHPSRRSSVTAACLTITVSLLSSRFPQPTLAFTLSSSTHHHHDTHHHHLSRQHRQQQQEHSHSFVELHAVAFDAEKDETKMRQNRDENNNDNNNNAWIETESGGFLPNFINAAFHRSSSSSRDATTRVSNHKAQNTQEEQRQQAAGKNSPVSPPPPLPSTSRTPTKRSSKTKKKTRSASAASNAAAPGIQVVSSGLLDYKRVVVTSEEAQNNLVCVRFYAPWCRACRAVARPFARLAKQFPPPTTGEDDDDGQRQKMGVKFVDAPLNEANGRLFEGLGVPSLPFCHLYHPTAGLVEEQPISKKHFKKFRDEVLTSYVEGQCPVNYDDDKDDAMIVAEEEDDEELPPLQ